MTSSLKNFSLCFLKWRRVFTDWTNEDVKKSLAEFQKQEEEEEKHVSFVENDLNSSSLSRAPLTKHKMFLYYIKQIGSTRRQNVRTKVKLEAPLFYSYQPHPLLL